MKSQFHRQKKTRFWGYFGSISIKKDPKAIRLQGLILFLVMDNGLCIRNANDYCFDTRPYYFALSLIAA